ncbi:MAG: hypothetical protein GQ533_02750, partial [Methanosarcinaceae archaeon]|nr:hypothetical protein [Methanosarcinaceae archaeon]
ICTILRAREINRHTLGKYGARPLRRVIQNEVETRVGKLIVSGEVMEGADLVVDVDDRGIVVRVD